MNPIADKPKALQPLYPPLSRVASWRPAGIIAGFRGHRFLVRQLVKVNLQAEFKRSFLGMSWLLILPLFSVLIWILLNGAGVVNPGATDIPYPAFVLLSTSIWGFFLEIYKGSSNIFVRSGRMLTNTPFPYEALVTEQVVVHLIRFAIPFALNLIVLLFFGVRFTWLALLFPLTLLPLLALGLAIGLVTSLLRIVALDVARIIDEGMRLLMFLTPVVYAPKLQISWLSDIVALNPLTYLVSFSRNILTKGTFYEPFTFCCMAFMAFLCLFIALGFLRFGRLRIIERLINS